MTEFFVLVSRRFRRRWKNVLLMLLSLFALIGGLYQIEIATICAIEGRLYDFPFHIFPSINPWVARDIMYLVVVLSWFLLFASLWWWD